MSAAKGRSGGQGYNFGRGEKARRIKARIRQIEAARRARGGPQPDEDVPVPSQEGD